MGVGVDWDENGEGRNRRFPTCGVEMKRREGGWKSEREILVLGATASFSEVLATVKSGRIV